MAYGNDMLNYTRIMILYTLLVLVTTTGTGFLPMSLGKIKDTSHPFSYLLSEIEPLLYGLVIHTWWIYFELQEGKWNNIQGNNMADHISTWRCDPFCELYYENGLGIC